jgi:hypothetical protein
MQQLLAIAGLTWKAAFRFRLFLVLAVLLLAAVVGLPLLIKDDGTARGFTQILLTYTLSAITGLLGLSTLWLACGTLARDIEECQMQMVAVKPVARWQIWLGKWVGLVTLNAALLAVAGGGVYLLLNWRAGKLPANEQAILKNEVLVARASAKEGSYDAQIDQETEKALKERLEKNPVDPADLPEVRKQIREQLKAELQVVQPGGGYRPWEIDLSSAKEQLRGRPLQLRVKFNAAAKSSSGTFDAWWVIGVPEKTPVVRLGPMSLAPDTFHEFEIPADLFDENGILTIVFVNRNPTALLFPLEDGMEVLYRQGGFGANFCRGLGIILCWMALLAALGLAAASFLTFPVAAFFSLAVLTLGLSSGTMSAAVESGTIASVDEETGGSVGSMLDVVVIPTFKGLLRVIHLVEDFSPVEALSSGRMITWAELGQAVTKIVLVMGGLLALFGIIVFNRRELATAQGTQ